VGMPAGHAVGRDHHGRATVGQHVVD